jgi:hypothetical protein
MALSQQPTDFSPAAFRRLDPTKYTSLGDFINEVNKPDNRDMLVKTYGTQTITGFLQMTLFSTGKKLVSTLLRLLLLLPLQLLEQLASC